jgi:exodeoxyribonuclease III
MRIATYNCNGIRTRMGAMFNWLARNIPDVLAVQETKVPDVNFPVREFNAMGWKTCYVGQPSYNGVCIISRHTIELISRVLPGWDCSEARFIHVRVNGVDVINTYVPHGRTLDHEQYKHKVLYFAALRKYLEKFVTTLPIVWVGDLNVAYRPEDVYAEMRKPGPCYSDEIRQAMADTASWGLYDVFLKFNPGVNQYSCWDYRVPMAVDSKKGWRVDYILASDVLASSCTSCWIDESARMTPKPSDHTYVVADFAYKSDAQPHVARKDSNES